MGPNGFCKSFKKLVGKPSSERSCPLSAPSLEQPVAVEWLVTPPSYPCGAVTISLEVGGLALGWFQSPSGWTFWSYCLGTWSREVRLSSCVCPSDSHGKILLMGADGPEGYVSSNPDLSGIRGLLSRWEQVCKDFKMGQESAPFSSALLHEGLLCSHSSWLPLP